MRIIIELEGPVLDVREAWYAAHLLATEHVAWARLDRERFFRLIRKHGTDADVVPGASAAKLNAYRLRFAELLHAPNILQVLTVRSDAVPSLASLARFGRIDLITLGRESAIPERLLRDAGAFRFVHALRSLDPDPRRRPAELAGLSGNDARAMVVACSDAVIRSADQAGIFTVGLNGGPFDGSLMHRAGVRTVFRTLRSVADELQTGAQALVHAGFQPASLG